MRDREGNVRELPGKVSITLRAGDTIAVEIPEAAAGATRAASNEGGEGASGWSTQRAPEACHENMVDRSRLIFDANSLSREHPPTIAPCDARPRNVDAAIGDAAM
jgi:hypothetical protein